MRESVIALACSVLFVGVLVGFGAFGVYLLLSGLVWYGSLLLAVSGVLAAAAIFGPTDALRTVAEVLRKLTW